MSSMLYLVLQSRGRWWVDIEGRSLGPFDSQDVATFAAIDAAGQDYLPGRTMQVYAEKPDRRFALVWSSTQAGLEAGDTKSA
jgi:hypothetical protein